MGERGPARKPTKLRQLEGNPGKRPLPANEPQPTEMSELPKPPSFLDAIAKKHWKLVGTELMGCGLLTNIDLDALAACCNCYSQWVKAQQELKKSSLIVVTPNGFRMPSPYIKIANDSLDRMMRYLKEFGMTPASRSRVEVDPGEDEGDEFLKLLKESKK